MIGHITYGGQFGRLVGYLLRGRSGQENDRVAWTACRNLAFDDEELAPDLMRATATQNPRVERAVAHIVVSFDPADSVSRAQMLGVGVRLLDDLRLGEHQALFVAHRDRWHPHFHLAVNRVHPDTGLGWSTSKAYVRIQRSLRAQERALGLREVVGRLYRLPDQKPAARTYRVRHETAHPRRGQRSEPVERGRRIEEAVQRVRDVAVGRHIRDRFYQVEQTASLERARLAHLGWLKDQAVTLGQSFDRALSAAYRDPAAARRAFDDVTRRSGRYGAVQALVETPERLGALRVGGDSAARAQVREAARIGGLANSAADSLRQQLRIPNGTSVSDAYTQAVTQSEHRLAAAEREIARVEAARRDRPDIRTAERAAHVALHALAPNEIAQLSYWLTGPQLALAEQARRIVLDLALGRDQGIASPRR